MRGRTIRRGTIGPVWRASRAAVRRRRLQTFILGLVVLFSSATIVVALGLLVASSAPFDRAFTALRGAHVVATFDPTRASAEQLAATADRPGVVAVAGPFAQTVLDVDPGDTLVPGLQRGPLTVVARPGPDAPVDRLDLWHGRWPTGPGEIVLNSPPDRAPMYPLDAAVTTTDGSRYAIVGYAFSVSGTADAWVAPGQGTAPPPAAHQLLYRFTDADTAAEVAAGLSAATEGLPADALLASQSYLVVKEAAAAGPGAYVPFLIVFGVLGLAVAVLIVGNVVSGAVVSGYRHIGVLKALGFTPGQVVAVYLVMASVPGAIGCVLGTVAGSIAARPLLASAFQGMGFAPTGTGWVAVAVLLGMPAVVALAALVPALPARRLSAAAVLSAGSVSRTGRGLRIQRWLSRTRLPRPVSLGLGLPWTRPGRTTLTAASVLLGVVTATFASGLASTVSRYAEVTDLNDTAQVGVRAGSARFGDVTSTRTDEQIEALLRSLPGARYVTVSVGLPVTVVGHTGSAPVSLLRGDADSLGMDRQLVAGRWLAGPGEVVAPSAVLHHLGLAVGDRMTLRAGDRQVGVTIVGETMASALPGGDDLMADWAMFPVLAPDRPLPNSEVFYQVGLAPGTHLPTYLAAVRAADPGLAAWDNTGTNSFTVSVVSLATTLTVMLVTVAALGVFNTVVLNTRERRRDLGMLKSIGMTPRQVVAMMVTSMAALGLVGGLVGVPLGMLAHRVVVPAVGDAAQVRLAASLLDVWHAPGLGVLAVAGIVIAGLGAFLPARSAARLPIAEVLHNE